MTNGQLVAHEIGLRMADMPGWRHNLTLESLLVMMERLFLVIELCGISMDLLLLLVCEQVEAAVKRQPGV